MMSRAKKAAARIQELYCVERLSDLDLELAIYGQGLELQTRKMKGALGQLIRHQKRAIVNISDEIHHQGQKRFVMAHELGHWEMHKELEIPAYIDTEAELLKWHSSQTQHEREANEFAAEILMPERYFKEKCKGRKISAGLISDLSNIFASSLAATAIRFAQIGNEPVIVAYSINGMIQWMHSSKDFRFGTFEKLRKPPSNSQTAKFYESGRAATDPQVVLAESWFSNDWRVGQKYYLYEHVIPFKRINGCLTLIWEHEENHSVDEDEEKYFEERGKIW